MIFREALEKYLLKIKAREPMAMLRFADGELLLVDGLAVGPDTQASRVDGWQAPAKLTRLGQDLRTILESQEPNLHFGIPCPCCDLKGYERMRATINRSPAFPVNLFINGNYQRFRTFLPELASLPVAVIANDRADLSKLPFPVLKALPVPADGVSFYESRREGLLAAARDFCRGLEKTVVLVAAGPLSEMLIFTMWNTNPHNTYVDVGSSLDEIVYGRQTRAYMRPGDTYASRMCDLPDVAGKVAKAVSVDPATQAPLSVCMIVGPGRTAEAARALDTVRPYVREVTLVFPCPLDADSELGSLAAKYADKCEYRPDLYNAEFREITDFGAARNASFRLATQPWRMWLDTDDEVVGAERLLTLTTRGAALLEEQTADIPNTGVMFFVPYVINDVHSVVRERIVFDAAATWIRPVHETLETSAPDRTFCLGINAQTLAIVHKPGERGNLNGRNERNLRILKNYRENHPEDPWALLEIGKESFGTCDWPAGIESVRAWLAHEGRARVQELVARTLLTEALLTLCLIPAAEEEVRQTQIVYPESAVPKRFAAWLAFLHASGYEVTSCSDWARVRNWERAKALAVIGMPEGQVDAFFAGNARCVFTTETMAGIIRKSEHVLAEMRLITETRLMESYVRERPDFEYKEYWEYNYAKGGNSGGGSYGKLAEFKAGFINAYLESHPAVLTVTEFGCGDGNQLLLMNYPEYVGLDVSKSAVERCRKICANDQTRHFQVYDPQNFSHDRQSDLVVCLDVLYHIVDDSDFDKTLRDIFTYAKKTVILYTKITSEEPTLSCHVRNRDILEHLKKYESRIRSMAITKNPHSDLSSADFILMELCDA